MDIENKQAVELLKLAILSHYVQTGADKSVSVILIAEPELDKTRTLERFYDIKGARIQTDISYMGILTNVLPRIQTGELKTIIIPDMLKPIMKKQSTMENFVSILNSLIEEGVHEITFRGTQDFKGARCNLLSSITPELFFSKRLIWSRMGFLSRFLPFTYSYTEEKKQRVMKAIQDGTVKKAKPIQMQLPEFKTNQIFLPPELAKKLEPFVEVLLESEKAKWTTTRGKKTYSKKGQGFRHQHQLQSLLRASALEKKRTVVTMDDFKRIENLSTWLNYNFKTL